MPQMGAIEENQRYCFNTKRRMPGGPIFSYGFVIPGCLCSTCEDASYSDPEDDEEVDLLTGKDADEDIGGGGSGSDGERDRMADDEDVNA